MGQLTGSYLLHGDREQEVIFYMGTVDSVMPSAHSVCFPLQTSARVWAAQAGKESQLSDVSKAHGAVGHQTRASKV